MSDLPSDFFIITFMDSMRVNVFYKKKYVESGADKVMVLFIFIYIHLYFGLFYLMYLVLLTIVL